MSQVNNLLETVDYDEHGLGYTIIPELLPKELVREVHSHIDRLRFSDDNDHTRKLQNDKRLRLINDASLLSELHKLFIGPEDHAFLLDEEAIGLPNITWRLFHPNQQTGPWHRDRWLWTNNFNLDEHFYLKLWVAIQTEPYHNGLEVMPHSQEFDLVEGKDYVLARREDGRVKVEDNFSRDLRYEINRLPLEAGDAVLFHYDLLHHGIVNTGLYNRISLETTIVIPLQERFRWSEYTPLRLL